MKCTKWWNNWIWMKCTKWWKILDLDEMDYIVETAPLSEF